MEIFLNFGSKYWNFLLFFHTYRVKILKFGEMLLKILKLYQIVTEVSFHRLAALLTLLLDRICMGCINSLAPGRFQFNFRLLIYKLTLVNGGWGISYEIALRWMPLDFTDDKSTLVQVMAWCRQATSHCLSQCWPRSMSPYGVIRP